jgi:hypothetical protein
MRESEFWNQTPSTKNKGIYASPSPSPIVTGLTQEVTTSTNRLVTTTTAQVEVGVTWGFPIRIH